MTWVIVTGALGGVTVTGGLFLRRLLGELAYLRSQLTETGRQITGIDRQMRAQRARVNFIRQLIIEGTIDDEQLPPETAVVNGDPATEAGEPHGDRPEPVRRKRHLGLYIGGAVAAVGTFSTAARLTARVHRGAVAGATAAAAITAATVSMVTVEPWTHSISHRPPPSTAPSMGSTATAPLAASTPYGGRPPGSASSTARPSPAASSPAPAASPSMVPSRPAGPFSRAPVIVWFPSAARPAQPAPTVSVASATTEEVVPEDGGASSPPESPPLSPVPDDPSAPMESPPLGTPSSSAACLSADTGQVQQTSTCPGG